LAAETACLISLLAAVETVAIGATTHSIVAVLLTEIRPRLRNTAVPLVAIQCPIVNRMLARIRGRREIELNPVQVQHGQVRVVTGADSRELRIGPPLVAQEIRAQIAVRAAAQVAGIALAINASPPAPVALKAAVRSVALLDRAEVRPALVVSGVLPARDEVADAVAEAAGGGNQS
jgi:hypothetical protein